MKKIILFLVLCFINVCVHGYEYIIARGKDNNENIILYYDDNNKLMVSSPNGVYALGTNNGVYNELSSIKGLRNSSVYDYITDNDFKNIYKDNLNFLNDLYNNNANTRNAFLNYLYNNNYFDHITYNDYRDYILYYDNSGLCVESVVNGVFGGLYDNVSIYQSGYLYYSNGELALVNGQEPNFFQRLYEKLDFNHLFERAVFFVDMVWFISAVFALVVFFFGVRYVSGAIDSWCKRRNL